MLLIGSQFIGSATSRLGEEAFMALNALTGESLPTEFFVATKEEVDAACDSANEAYGEYKKTSNEARAQFLELIAEGIEALGDSLIERCAAETALPTMRLEGERARTCGQLRMFANVVREGSWRDVRIEQALPDREPIPRPDLRRMLVPIGPVAVFGASNFPLAFSVAGGDTASALAAGCPVVVKAHPAHPGTSEMVARAIIKAAVCAGMPDGVFSMVHGHVSTGEWLVQNHFIQAVGFTGSQHAGRSLYDLAASRSNPIPVFAEMGSVNPVFILPGALSERSEPLAEGLAASVCLGAGQFCTNPGLVIAMRSDEQDEFVNRLAESVAKVSPGPMLTRGILTNYQAGLGRLKSHPAVYAESEVREMGESVGGCVFSTDANSFLFDEVLSAEVFGPSTLVVNCNSAEEMCEVAANIEGQLTATIHHGAGDGALTKRLTECLLDKVGRLLYNGFPTGVEVGHAMQHGGPYPASSDSRFTSVGSAAIFRWLRPVCYQNAPQELLPPELMKSNPLGILRQVNGERTTAEG